MLRDIKVNNATNSIEVTLDYLKDYHVPEYSIDGYTFNPLGSNQIDVYNGDLTSEFNRNRHSVYIRVRNTKNDSIDFEYEHEPTFLVL